MILSGFPKLGRLKSTTDDNWISADQLLQKTDARVRQLNNKWASGDIIFIRHGGSADFVADLLAVWSIGACAACLNPGLTDNELTNLIRFIDPVAMLTSPTEAPVLFERDMSSQHQPVQLDDPALLLFTSGTTGDPKGVAHSFRSLLSRITLNQKYIGDTTLQSSLCSLPTHFGHGLIGNLLTPLLAGGDVLILADKSPAGLAGLGNLIDDHAIKFMSSVPSFWKIALKMSKPPVTDSLRRVHVGSAPLSVDLWRRISDWAGTEQIFNMYGITETANWIGGACLADEGAVDGKVGPVWGGSVMVVDEQNQRHRSGKGELVVQTPSLMTGYFKRPDLTSEVLKQGWFHTGDIGQVLENGDMIITGREKSEINRAGMKISPEEIDLLLERHDDIDEVCSFGLPDAISGEKVAVACVFRAGKTLSPEDLRLWLSKLIRREAIPEVWYFVSEIPKTDRGKINRNNVRQICLEGEQDK